MDSFDLDELAHYRHTVMDNPNSDERSYFSCLPKGKGKYLYEALTKHGSMHGRNAFDKLCGLGCNPDSLGHDLLKLCQTEPIILGRTKEEIPYRPLDSWDTALNGLTLDDVRAIADRARVLSEDIKCLKRTRLVQRLIREGIISIEDLLHGNIDDPRFDGLLKLPVIASQYGPQKRPEYTQRLTRIYQHINECTRRWHDVSLAAILIDLMPDSLISAEGLKQWRQRRGLKETRNARKS